MKKIALIDDNQANQRLDLFNIDFVDNGKYSDILMVKDKIAKTDNLSYLNEVACILIHKTFKDFDFENNRFTDETKVKMKVIEDISESGNQIPIVVFSGQDNDTAIFVNQNYISLLKKSTFYSRLEDFLLHFQETNEVELRIFAFGKFFLTEELKNCRSEIFEHIEKYESDYNLKMQDLLFKSKKSIDLYPIKRFWEIAFPDEDNSEKILYFQENEVTKQNLKEKLNNIVTNYVQYEKNISYW